MVYNHGVEVVAFSYQIINHYYIARCTKAKATPFSVSSAARYVSNIDHRYRYYYLISLQCPSYSIKTSIHHCISSAT